jgi:hypothetical protein
MCNLWILCQRQWISAHGIWRAFFDLRVEEKQTVAMPEAGYPYGCAPFAFERLASSLGDVTPPDLKETYSVGPVDPPQKQVAHRILGGPLNYWLTAFALNLCMRMISQVGYLPAC